MAGEITVKLRADPAPFNDGVADARKAVDTWTAAVESGAGDADAAFADVIRQLVKLGTEMGKTRADMVRDLQKVGFSAEDAEDAISAVERETADLGKNAPKDLDKAKDGLDKVTDSAGGVGDGLRSLGDIAKDVLAGDFSSAATGAVDSLAGIAEAAGIGGAAGSAIFGAVSGLVSSLIDKFGEYDRKVAEVRDSTSAALVEMGGAFDAATLQSRMQDLVNDTDKWAQALFISQQTGLDLGLVLSGLAGNADDAALASQAFADVWDKIPGSVDTQVMYDAKASIEGVTDALSGAPAKITAVEQGMKRQQDAADKATASTQGLAQGMRDLPNSKDVSLRVTVQDNTKTDVARIVRDINGQVARIQLSAGTNGRQLF